MSDWIYSGEPLASAAQQLCNSALVYRDTDGAHARITSGIAGIALWLAALASLPLLHCAVTAIRRTRARAAEDFQRQQEAEREQRVADQAAENRATAKAVAARAAATASGDGPLRSQRGGAVVVLAPLPVRAGERLKLQRGNRERYEEFVLQGQGTSAAQRATWLRLRRRLLDEGLRFAEAAENDAWIAYWRSEKGRLERLLSEEG